MDDTAVADGESVNPDTGDSSENDDSDSDDDSFSEDGELRMMTMVKSASTARVALVDSRIGCHSNTADDKPEYTVDEED